MQPAALEAKKRLLVFESDFSAYHLAFIRSGIERYFGEAEGPISFAQFGVNDLQRLYGPQVVERLVVIGLLRGEDARDYFASRGIPCLNLEELNRPPALGFDVRFEAEGTLAAKCFVEEMNLGRLAFVGNEGVVSHQRRLREFRREADTHRIGVDELHFPVPRMQRRFCDIPVSETAQERESLRGFLGSLRKPAGIFCANDHLALQFYYAAETMGLRVPEEIAILGVGSRERSKETWAHAVSVVQLDHRKLGRVAARLMNEFISSGKSPRSVRLRPNGIHHSQTTFRWTVSDPLVGKALVLIQRDPSLGVLPICEQLKLSRSTLDLRFRSATNVSLAKAIEIERFNQAKDLVKNKSFSFEAIASLAGYPNSRAMRRSFVRFTQMSPQQFRELSSREKGATTPGRSSFSTEDDRGVESVE